LSTSDVTCPSWNLWPCNFSDHWLLWNRMNGVPMSLPADPQWRQCQKSEQTCHKANVRSTPYTPSSKKNF